MIIGTTNFPRGLRSALSGLMVVEVCCAMMIFRILPFGLALLIGPACHSQSASTSPAVRWEIIQQWSGQNDGGAAPSARALRTMGEWNAFWKQVNREPPSTPDFNRHMAVIISLGEKRTGGFGVEIIGARRDNRTLVVAYRETAPEPGMMVTQALTAPWAVALVPRSDFPVVGKSVATPKPHEK